MTLMMRRGQGILEYAFMIGIAAAVIIAMAAYAKRGFQGYVRGASEQIGSGQYSTNNTTANKNVIKNISSSSVSTSTSTTVYGNGGSESPEMQANQEQQDQLRTELAALNAEKLIMNANNSTATDITGINRAGIANTTTTAQWNQVLGAIDNSIREITTQLTTLSRAYTTLSNEYAAANDDDKPAIAAEMAENQRQQQQLRGEITDLNNRRQAAVNDMNSSINTTAITPVVTSTDTPMTLAQIQARIDAINTQLASLATAYAAAMDAWDARVITPDQTTSNSSNVETGTQTTNSLTDENLGSLGNDSWRR
jgi:hypothetical protein